MRNLKFGTAGFVFRVFCRGADKEAFTEFSGKSLAPVVTIVFEHVQPPESAAYSRDYLVQCFSDLSLPQYLAKRVTRSFSTDGVWENDEHRFLANDLPTETLFYLFCQPQLATLWFRDACLRGLANALVVRKGLVIHGSGGIIRQSGFMIVGVSGAGKTTALDLIKPDFVLSDDRLAVRNVNDRPSVFSTPFGRKSHGNAEAPVKAVFFPRKSQRFHICPLKQAGAFLRFVAEQYQMFSRTIPQFRGEVFRHAHNLFKRVPSYELHFSKEQVDREKFIHVLGEDS